MMAASSGAVVAVVNTSEDITAFLTQVLAEEGYCPVVGYVIDFREGRQDLAAFLAEHHPAAMIWDIAFPYEQNWAFFQAVQADTASHGCRVVLTTTNKRALEDLVGPTSTRELLGKPYDLDQLLTAVQQAVAASAD
jgi:CheY-like chemotaxis protein